MAAFPSQQMYLNQLANSRRMGKMQYKALQRQMRMESLANSITGVSYYCHTGQAQMATGVAYRHQDQMLEYAKLQQDAALAALQSGISSYQPGALSGQASNPQDSLASLNAGRISKSFAQEAKPAETAKAEEALKTYTLRKPLYVGKPKKNPKQESPKQEKPKLTLETSPVFGRSQFGMFYNWRFDNPINALRMWLFRHAYRHQRGFS